MQENNPKEHNSTSFSASTQRIDGDYKIMTQTVISRNQFNFKI